ncbi:MAG: hypothetical protein H7245_05950, partial [Candidatus Saccharibacteria bacterium]|nr:hypothetical protein [Pseudorhodobacter sp.]
MTNAAKPWQPVAAAVLAAVLLLSACATPPVPPPPVPPAPTVAAPPPPESAASASIRAYYAEVQQALLSQGLLRTDGAAVDAPFTDRNLTDNFIRIAMYEEYSRGQISTTRSQTPIRLLRWDKPIRVSV